MRKLERSVESTFVRLVKERGWKTYKVSGPGDVGKPDRLVLAGGRAFFGELKRPGEVPTKRQNLEMLALLDAGFLAFWADDAVDAVRYIEHVIEHPVLTHVLASKEATIERLRRQGVRL